MAATTGVAKRVEVWGHTGRALLKGLNNFLPKPASSTGIIGKLNF
jgi:hypothetical protein